MTPAPGPTRVLIVDDDALARSILTDLFVEAGYEADVAHTAEQALAKVQTEPYDVLLTDLNLPSANGLQLIHVCRTVAPHMRTVAMSAYASAADYKTARRLGAVELLVKPFRLEEAVEAVRRAEHRRPGYRASFDGLSLTDVLQTCHQLRKSVTVTIEGVGVAYFDDGELVHAEAGGLVGMPALVALIASASWHLSVGAPAEVPRTLHRAFANTLLEALTTLEGQRAGQLAQLDDALDEASFDEAFAQFEEVEMIEIPARAPQRVSRVTTPPPLPVEAVDE